MGTAIFLGIWGGIKFDEYLGITSHIFTIILSMAGVAVALYLVIKNLSH